MLIVIARLKSASYCDISNDGNDNNITTISEVVVMKYEESDAIDTKWVIARQEPPGALGQKLQTKKTRKTAQKTALFVFFAVRPSMNGLPQLLCIRQGKMRQEVC